MKDEWWIVVDAEGRSFGAFASETLAEVSAKNWAILFPNDGFRVLRVVPVDDILATLKDPANVHQMMLRGTIAPIGWRLTCHLTGEVPNGEDVQLAEIVRLREEVKALREHLAFVERWANHHGRKPHVTAAEALGVIQHYPPIVEITESYADGVVPDTRNPFAEVEALRAEVESRIATAVAAERERCARVAEESTAYTAFQGVEHYKLASAIAHAIREPKP